jgi:hypothetical protein
MSKHGGNHNVDMRRIKDTKDAIREFKSPDFFGFNQNEKQLFEEIFKCFLACEFIKSIPKDEVKYYFCEPWLKTFEPVLTRKKSVKKSKAITTNDLWNGGADTLKTHWKSDWPWTKAYWVAFVELAKSKGSDEHNINNFLMAVAEQRGYFRSLLPLGIKQNFKKAFEAYKNLQRLNNRNKVALTKLGYCDLILNKESPEVIVLCANEKNKKRTRYGGYFYSTIHIPLCSYEKKQKLQSEERNEWILPSHSNLLNFIRD